MNEDTIKIRINDALEKDCSSAIIVPEKAINEPGYIKTVTVSAHAHSKHEFHAMAQTAYFQFQDGELEVEPMSGNILVEWGKDVVELDSGMVIYRDVSGDFHIVAHSGQNLKKLLEAANRYCTRWVRLDI